jgi:hypothetical protein
LTAIVAKKLRFVKVGRKDGAVVLDMQVRTGGRKELLGTAAEVKERTVLILARQKRPANISLKYCTRNFLASTVYIRRPRG